MAVEPAGPYASLHLAPDRQPCQHPTAQFLEAGCPSGHPTNSDKALKAIIVGRDRIVVSTSHGYRNTHTHTRLTTLFPGVPRSAGTRKPIWILLQQETVSGSGISWAICKSAPCSRQITTPVPHHSVFYRPDALPAAQPTASKH